MYKTIKYVALSSWDRVNISSIIVVENNIIRILITVIIDENLMISYFISI